MNKIEDKTVKEDESAEFSYQLKGSNTEIKWLLNGEFLNDDKNNVKIIFENGVSTLRIAKCQLDNNGEISCQLGDRKKTTAKLIVQG